MVRGMIFAAALALAGAAQAQDYVRADCRPLLATGAARFDSPEHALWYRRFWSGDCARLAFCVSGSPNWSEVMSRLERRAPAPEKAMVLTKGCRLGQLIGMEWSRARSVRHLDTTDLRWLSNKLRTAQDPLQGLETVEALARAKIRRRPPARPWRRAPRWSGRAGRSPPGAVRPGSR